MSRRRYISTKISSDKRVNQLAQQAGDFAALLYTWMIPHAEDDARLTGDPEEILMEVMPGRRDKSTADISAALQAMHDLGLIVWNEAEGYVEFPPEKFYTYQSYVGTANRRGGTPPSDEQRKTPENAGKKFSPPKPAENAASSSPSFSLSDPPPLSLSPSARASAPARETPEREISLPVSKDEDATPSPKPANLEDKLRRNGIRGALTDLWGKPDKAEQDEWDDGVDKIFADGYTGDDVRRAIPLFEERRSKSPHKPYLLAKNMRSLLSEGQPRASPDTPIQPVKHRSHEPSEEEIAEYARALQDAFSAASGG